MQVKELKFNTLPNMLEHQTTGNILLGNRKD